MKLSLKIGTFRRISEIIACIDKITSQNYTLPGDSIGAGVGGGASVPKPGTNGDAGAIVIPRTSIIHIQD